MQLNEHSAMEILASMGIDDMPVVEYTPKKCSLDADWFKKYSALRREFLSSLTDAIEEITFMNLGQDEFVNLVMGKSLPDNLSIRFRVPLFLGGELDVSNMFLCWTFPISFNLDRFLINQNDATTIFLPNPEKKIYLTSHTGGGGDGGNATSDRLTEAVFSFKNSRGNE